MAPEGGSLLNLQAGPPGPHFSSEHTLVAGFSGEKKAAILGAGVSRDGHTPVLGTSLPHVPIPRFQENRPIQTPPRGQLVLLRTWKMCLTDTALEFLLSSLKELSGRMLS